VQGGPGYIKIHEQCWLNKTLYSYSLIKIPLIIINVRGMSIGSKFSVVVVLVFLLCSMAVVTQMPKSQAESSNVNIDDALKSVGLPPDIRIIKVNDLTVVKLKDPILVVKGSGMDQLEQQVYDALSQKYSMNSSYLIDDRTHTFDGQNIENYDIICVGGPLHNAFTSELLDRGILYCKYVYFKDHGLVVEAKLMPSGHTVLVVGSFASYPYKEPPNNSTVPQEPGGGGWMQPTPEPGTASATPENLHVTAQATVTPGHHDDKDYMAELEKQLLENGLSKNDAFMKFLMKKYDIEGYFSDTKISDKDKEEMVNDIVEMTGETNTIREFTNIYNMMMSVMGCEGITKEDLKKMGMSDEEIEMIGISETPSTQNPDSDEGGIVDDLYYDVSALGMT
jgi:hypothetical protein